ncbi:hypothetical protein M758_1G328500 [Ceratodon purpureus]|uniref:Uncharacterized protein n=1 Tax=Ceratodon purpureus TaxID=3225 RepID=A0A8T0JEW2_CERPU|nr:hypothetical protein KC19_1G336000 [Ceratodon purpureus]KAG0632438.1 hypothetical protein M758_1G328500 [Ceratodon purpureus]
MANVPFLMVRVSSERTALRFEESCLLFYNMRTLHKIKPAAAITASENALNTCLPLPVTKCNYSEPGHSHRICISESAFTKLAFPSRHVVVFFGALLSTRIVLQHQINIFSADSYSQLVQSRTSMYNIIVRYFELSVGFQNLHQFEVDSAHEYSCYYFQLPVSNFW